MPNNNKWVVDYGNMQMNIILSKEFDSEEEAIVWGKKTNSEHFFYYTMGSDQRQIPLTYMHMVYEPKILNDVAPPYQKLNELDNTPAQGIEESIKVNGDTAAQDKEGNKVKTIKVYRVEDPKEGHGLWRDFNGDFNPVFNKLTKGKCKDMPMEDSDFYREDGKMWFSATDTPEKLTAWFSALDVVELEKLGYNVYEFEVEEWRPVNEYEVVFTRESIKWVKAIDPIEIWGEEYTNLKGEV